MTMKTQQLKTYGMQQKCPKREVYSNTTLPKHKRKTSNRPPNFTSKTTGKRTTTTKKKNSRLEKGKKS